MDLVSPCWLIVKRHLYVHLVFDEIKQKLWYKSFLEAFPQSVKVNQYKYKEGRDIIMILPSSGQAKP